jgi:hypothetical protein
MLSQHLRVFEKFFRIFLNHRATMNTKFTENCRASSCLSASVVQIKKTSSTANFVYHSFLMNLCRPHLQICYSGYIHQFK